MPTTAQSIGKIGTASWLMCHKPSQSSIEAVTALLRDLSMEEYRLFKWYEERGGFLDVEF